MNEREHRVWGLLHSMETELQYSLDWMIRGQDPVMPKQFWQMIFKYQERVLAECKEILEGRHEQAREQQEG